MHFRQRPSTFDDVRSARVILRNFDPRDGGFGRAPKFPHPMDIKVLLRHHARAIRPAWLALDRSVAPLLSGFGMIPVRYVPQRPLFLQPPEFGLELLQVEPDFVAAEDGS